MPQPGMPQPGLPVEFDWINENWSGCSKSCASGNYPVQLTQLLLLTISCTQPAPQTTVNLRLSPSTKQGRNPCSRSPPVYHDLSTRHDWTVKNPIVNLPIRLKGNSKISDNEGIKTEEFSKQASSRDNYIIMSLRRFYRV